MDEKTDLKRHLILILCLVLTLANLAVYGQVKDHEFLTYDDNEYVVENSHVRSGLTWGGIRWSLTSVHSSNWHPLTWVSHMLDCELYGLNPSGHHLNNLLIHMVNTLLLFLLLRKLTGAVWRSFLAASLFALHPLHVESVAWVAERKDVLSGLFWMLTLWAYGTYAERGGRLRYGLCLLLFLTGLLAKPMLVTLPFVFLLLDFWPLGRLHRGKGVLLEKVPFLLFSAASSTITYLTQQGWGAVSEQVSLPVRAANAAFSYAHYLVKMLFPYPLSFFYPHPLDSLSLFQVMGASILLGGFTVLAFRFSAKIPYLTLGWLWYLGTLIPVIGLVQVGSHGMADRYTYIPLIGPFIVLAWGSAHLTSKWARLKGPITLLWAGGVATLMILSWVQVGKWKDSVVLYRHGIQVDPGNLVAHFNLGNILAKRGSLSEAEQHLRMALRVRSGDASVHNNLANALVKQGKLEEGILHYEEALRLKPNDAPAHNNLANALVKQGKHEQGILHYRETLRIDPDFPHARFNLERTLQKASISERDGSGPSF